MIRRSPLPVSLPTTMPTKTAKPSLEVSQPIIETETNDPVVIQEHDGALVNELTGEVLGYAGSPFCPPPMTIPEGVELSEAELAALKAERDAQLNAAVTWATERRARAEAAMKAKTFERDMLIAGINERFEGQIKEQKRRIDWIDNCYGPAMKEFAKNQLEGGKQKSVKLPWATLGFRATKGKLEVTDAPLAAWSLLQTDEKLAKAVEVTISLGDILEPILFDRETGEEGESVNTKLVDAIMETFFPEYSSTDEEEKLDKVDVIRGVKVSILASHVPDEIPEGVKGLERKKSDEPLGEFYVKHG